MYNKKIEIMKPLKSKLQNELNKNDIEPNVKMYVDSSSIFWMVEDDTFLFISDHSGILEYIDETHHIIENYANGEGVGVDGVIWNNLDFENPFHISEFQEAVNTVNI